MQSLRKRMVTRHLMLLATLFLQSNRPSCTARSDILHLHLQGSTDACEGIGEGGDQQAVPQVPYCLRRNSADQLPPLLAIEHRSLAGLHDMLRPAHG
jgi:hypothetical protein